jgi:7-cyano-7-deazaguanine synthase
MEGDCALVLFSGGQDSTTCLAWALSRYARVETVGFAYGQRHAVELACRAPIRQSLAGMADWGARLGPDHLLDIETGLAAVGTTGLTGEAEIAMTSEGLPNTFVPGRNLLFLTYAAAIGWRRGLRRIVGGMCETDYSGYPDCRDDTMKAMQLALNLGMQRRADPRAHAHLLSRRARHAA